MRARPEVAELASRLIAGDRAALARAITLAESTLVEDRDRFAALEDTLASRPTKGWRVGVTGVPGVGKSTFIEALGCLLTRRGHAVAVLAVDPSSVRGGGSILADKTRMTELARDPRAFVRPSPAGGAHGGVARHTRDAIFLCEAAGFDICLVETVGVGQSETLVSEMVDFFVVLMLPGAGDEIQGIKRGILELADLVAVNKADGATTAPANLARAELERSLRLMQPKEDWEVPVVTCSAQAGTGIAELWTLVEDHRRRMEASGRAEVRRADQATAAMWRAIEQGLVDRVRADPDLVALLGPLEGEVRAGTTSPERAARQVLDLVKFAR